MSTRVAFAVSLALTLVVLAGCDGGDTTTTDTTTPVDTTPPSTEPTTFAVYLLRGGVIAPVRRSVPSTPAVARAALEALLEGPTGDERRDGLETAIPVGTSLRDVTIDDSVATVDLTGAFDDGDGGAAARRRVAQVVATLTQFPTVDRVAFRLDGAAAETIGAGAVDLDPPVGRGAIEEETPQILIEFPLPGDTVSSPVQMRGTANVFEATVSLEVRDGTGTAVLEAFTTATSGTGTRGSFETTLSLPELEGPMTLVAFESSAEDGRPLHVVDVQVTLTR